jgi:cell division protein FtsQ
MARSTFRRTRSPAPTSQRPSRLRLWLRRRRGLARPAALALVGIVALGGLAYGVISAGVVGGGADKLGPPRGRFASLGDGIAGIGARAGLTVREVVLEGSRYTPRDLALQAVAVRRGEPTLGFSPQAARERLESIPWIERAHVERHLPGTIRVVVEERTPFAVWQRDNRFSVIDRKGRVLTTENVIAFSHLPLVVGAGAEHGAAPMVELLRRASALEQRVQALVRVGERRWNLRLRNGTDVLLPEGHEAEAVTRLAELQASNALLDRPLTTIDMRQPDKLVLRSPPTPAAPPPTPPDPASVQRARSGGGRG